MTDCNYDSYTGALQGSWVGRNAAQVAAAKTPSDEAEDRVLLEQRRSTNTADTPTSKWGAVRVKRCKYCHNKILSGGQSCESDMVTCEAPHLLKDNDLQSKVNTRRLQCLQNHSKQVDPEITHAVGANRPIVVHSINTTVNSQTCKQHIASSICHEKQLLLHPLWRAAFMAWQLLHDMADAGFLL